MCVRCITAPTKYIVKYQFTNTFSFESLIMRRADKVFCLKSVLCTSVDNRTAIGPCTMKKETSTEETEQTPAPVGAPKFQLLLRGH